MYNVDITRSMNVVNMTDHQFAEKMRELEAIDTYAHIGNLTVWFTPERVIVGAIVYDINTLETDKYIHNSYM